MTDVRPAALDEYLQEHANWCVVNGVLGNSEQSIGRLEAAMPSELMAYIKRQAAASALDAAFAAVEAAGLGYWWEGAFRIPPVHQVAARKPFGDAFLAHLTPEES